MWFLYFLLLNSIPVIEGFHNPRHIGHDVQQQTLVVICFLPVVISKQINKGLQRQRRERGVVYCDHAHISIDSNMITRS